MLDGRDTSNIGRKETSSDKFGKLSSGRAWLSRLRKGVQDGPLLKYSRGTQRLLNHQITIKVITIMMITVIRGRQEFL